MKNHCEIQLELTWHYPKQNDIMTDNITMTKDQNIEAFSLQTYNLRHNHRHSWYLNVLWPFITIKRYKRKIWKGPYCFSTTQYKVRMQNEIMASVRCESPLTTLKWKIFAGIAAPRRRSWHCMAAHASILLNRTCYELLPQEHNKKDMFEQVLNALHQRIPKQKSRKRHIWTRTM